MEDVAFDEVVDMDETPDDWDEFAFPPSYVEISRGGNDLRLAHSYKSSPIKADSRS